MLEYTTDTGNTVKKGTKSHMFCAKLDKRFTAMFEAEADRRGMSKSGLLREWIRRAHDRAQNASND
jgi:hypothetical protein